MAKEDGQSLSSWNVVLAVFIVWKILLFSIGFIAPYKVGLGLHDPWSAGRPPALISHTYKFDAGWYNGIATQGYQVSKSAPAFYPLFPGTIALISKLTHINTVWVAFMLNMIAAYFAFYYLYRLALDYLKSRRAAMTALLLFAFFPTAYFMHAMYGEALFCALAFAAFYYAKQRKWWIANSLVMLVAVSRLPGLVVAGAIGVEYLDSISFSYKKVTWSILSFLLAPVGLVLYAMHLNKVFHDPLAMLHAYNYGEWAYQKVNFNIPAVVWRQLHTFKESIINMGKGNQANLFDDGLAFASWVMLGVFVVWGYIKRLPWSWLVFMLGSFILFGSHTTFTSVNRYVLGMFPMYILLAKLLDKHDTYVAQLAITSSAFLMSFMYVLFVNGIWTA